MMGGEPAIILTRSNIRQLATVGDYFDAVATSFREYASGGIHSPMPMEIAGVNGAFHAKGASMAYSGRQLAALKLNGNFPLNPQQFGLPTVQGAILLCEAETGALLAILDSGEVTRRRTAAASAVAMDALAAENAETLLIYGCGVQGRAHLEAFTPLRQFRSILVFDTDDAKVRSLVEDYSGLVNCEIGIVKEIGEASRQSDVIVTATASNSAILDETKIRAGAFVAAVGADSKTKNEIAPELMRRAAVVADVAYQCADFGDLRAAIATGTMTRDAIRAELGEILTGAKPGRLSDDEIIIFDSTGAAFQDLAAAAMIVERARSAGIGAHVSLAA